MFLIGGYKLKHHITPKQAEELGDENFYDLFDEVVRRNDWAKYHHKKVTIAKLIESIRVYYQMNIYTVNEFWCVQLFDLKDCVNDGVDCVYENNSEELVDVLFETLKWSLIDKDQYIKKLLGNIK